MTKHNFVSHAMVILISPNFQADHQNQVCYCSVKLGEILKFGIFGNMSQKSDFFLGSTILWAWHRPIFVFF